jgi:hypothetical protein
VKDGRGARGRPIERPRKRLRVFWLFDETYERPDDTLKASAQLCVKCPDVSECLGDFEAGQRLTGGPKRAVISRDTVLPAAVLRVAGRVKAASSARTAGPASGSALTLPSTEADSSDQQSPSLRASHLRANRLPHAPTYLFPPCALRLAPCTLRLAPCTRPSFDRKPRWA